MLLWWQVLRLQAYLTAAGFWVEIQSSQLRSPNSYSCMLIPKKLQRLRFIQVAKWFIPFSFEVIFPN